MSGIIRKKTGPNAWETVSDDGGGGGFPIGSEWLQVIGDTIDSTPMGSTAETTWAVNGSAGDDLSLRAGGRWIDVLTEGWYSTALKVNINGAAAVITWQRIVTIGGPGTMNTIDEFLSADPTNLSNDMTGAIPAEFFAAGEALAIDMFADNVGSAGTYDVNVGEALWMITRIA